MDKYHSIFVNQCPNNTINIQIYADASLNVKPHQGLHEVPRVFMKPSLGLSKVPLMRNLSKAPHESSRGFTKPPHEIHEAPFMIFPFVWWLSEVAKYLLEKN